MPKSNNKKTNRIRPNKNKDDKFKLKNEDAAAQNQKTKLPQVSAPFGVNAAGQRLDASGNVWDPKTAKRDIYGGAFVQPGSKEARMRERAKRKAQKKRNK